jgi:ribosomal protein S18 acetylase RimI-like enzyme
MAHAVRVETHDRLAMAPSDEFLKLYGDVYAGAPYWNRPADVAEFAAEWGRLREEPGIRLVLARAADAVGFGLGHVVRPDSGWWGGAPTVRGASFGIAEFGVLAGWRRLGVARRLHDALLAGRGESRAVLWVRVDAPVARAVYDSWGYRVVGAVEQSPGYHVMCLDLDGRERIGHG